MKTRMFEHEIRAWLSKEVEKLTGVYLHPESMRFTAAQLFNWAREHYKNGVRAAAGYVSDFDRQVNHEFRLSDCILAKFNMRPKRVRKNKGNLLRVKAKKAFLAWQRSSGYEPSLGVLERAMQELGQEVRG